MTQTFTQVRRCMAATLLATAAATQAASLMVSGRIDLNVGRDIGSGDTRMGTGAMSYLAIDATHDIDADLRVYAKLQARINAENGTSNDPGYFLNTPSDTFWSQESSVGLASKKWGSITLGRQMTAALLAQLLADPWMWDNATAMFASTTGYIGNLWYNRAVTYQYNNGAYGLTAQVAQRDDNPGWGTIERRSPTSLGLAYTPGTWQVRFGYERPADGTSKWATLFGSYDFHVATVNAEVGSGTNVADERVRTWLVSTVVPAGQGQVRAAYGTYRDAGVVASRKVSFGYYYSLDKSTAVYVNGAHDSEAPRYKSAYELGLQYAF